MRLGRIGLVGAIAGAVLGALVAMAGCDGTGDAVSGQDQGELHGGFGFHHGHRGRDAGSVGGGAAGSGGASGGVTTDGGQGVGPAAPTGGGSTVADCEICTQAQACCLAVDADQTACSFSAATCGAEQGDARPAYVNACLVFVVTVRGAWGGNPPAECR